MKTNALLKLHERQVDICSMIVDCSNRIRSKEKDLITTPDSIWWPANKGWITTQLTKYKGVKNRLIRYYLDIQERINKMQPVPEELNAENYSSLIIEPS